VETQSDGTEVRHYRSVTDGDLQREAKVLRLLEERFDDWQAKGYIPSRRIEPGDKTDEPIRTRGWTHWHHLFNPRQLLTLGTFSSIVDQFTDDRHSHVLSLLGLGRLADWNAKLGGWLPQAVNEKGNQVFSNQALNTKYDYCTRGLLKLDTTWYIQSGIARECEVETVKEYIVEPESASNVESRADFWITDPPYADAINYHELSEFFLAWYDKLAHELFPEWYTDSKRALAITGDEEGFRRDMVSSYRNLTHHMPDGGAQIVMFTHQDASVWADLALILWAAGLRVTAAWTIATETSTALKKGNYVQGTVLLILRKRTTDATAFTDELKVQIEDEVTSQLDAMQALDEDETDPSFGDTDYQLAAYAAALRVLTQYSSVEEWDIERELSRSRKSGAPSPIEGIIDEAVQIAADHLIPQGFDSFLWKTLTPAERLYLKGLELESHGEFRTGAYQELARGFGVREYKHLFANSRANETRFKNATEFGTKQLGGDGFAGSHVRHALFAIHEAREQNDAQAGRLWLRNEVTGYWSHRKKLIEILRFLAGMGAASAYWEDDAPAARLVAGAVENDHA